MPRQPVTTAWRRIAVRETRQDRGAAISTHVVCDDASKYRMVGTRVRDTHFSAYGTALQSMERDETSRLLVRGDLVVGVGRSKVRVHPVTLKLMEASGLDPLASCGWAAGPVTWHETGIEHESAPHNHMWFIDDEIMMNISHGRWWVDGRSLGVLGWLPETALIASIGRDLRDVVSIPGLDEHRIEILDAVHTEDGPVFTIVPLEGQISLHREGRCISPWRIEKWT